MRKYVIGIIIGIVLALSSTAIASTIVETSIFPVNFIFNGEKKELTGEYSTLNYNGHAYVPIRFIAENMDAGIAYHDQTKSISVMYEEDKPLLKDFTDTGKVYVNRVALSGKDGQTKITGDILIDPSESLNNSESEQVLCVFELAFQDKEGEVIGTVKNTLSIAKQDLGKIIPFEKMVDGELLDYDSIRLNVSFLDGDPIRGDKPPLAQVASENEQVKVIQGTYCWKGCADYAPAPDLINRHQVTATEVQSGEEIKVSFDYNPQPFEIKLQKYTGDSATPVDLQDGRFTVPAEKGVQIYRLDAYWHGGGEASYAFAVEVN